MDWERFDRFANRAQVPLTVGGYIGWGYTLWPKGAVLFGSPKNVNWIAVIAIGILCLGALSTASQIGLLRYLVRWRIKSKPKEHNESEQPSDTPISSPAASLSDVLVERINFDYLPASPLNHGWTVAYNDPGPGAKWLVPADAPISGGISIQMDDPGCAIDFRVNRNAALCDRLTCDAKFSDDTALLFLRVQLASRNGAQTTKFIKYVLGTEEPSPTQGYEESEWTLPIKPSPLPNGWRKLDIALAESVAQTWGSFGWSFRSLVAVRLRGKISISPISLYAQSVESQKDSQ